MSFFKNPKERVRFYKFFVVGIIGFFVDFGTLNLLRIFFGWPAEYRQVISFILAVCSNFIFNRFWTYPDSRTKPIGTQITQFFSVNIVGLIIRTVIFKIILGPLNRVFAHLEPALNDFIHGYGIEIASLSETLAENMDLAIVVIIVMFWNFFINRYWTYNDVK